MENVDGKKKSRVAIKFTSLHVIKKVPHRVCPSVRDKLESTGWIFIQFTGTLIPEESFSVY